MDKKDCFIIMPFSNVKFGVNEFDEKTLKYIYENIIKKAVLDYKDKNKKVFTEISRYESKIGSIITGIANNLNKADLVIADLTGMNPNVMYELGVRHSLRRGTIIITQDIKSIPSDLRDFMCVEYKYSNNTLDQNENYLEFKKDLHSTIKELFSTDKYDSPVLSYLKGKEKYWKEDEEKKLKENIVITNYIFEQFYDIERGIKEIEELKNHEVSLPLAFRAFNALLNNMNSALNDLNISVEASIMYENIQAAKSIISDIIRNLFLTEYMSEGVGKFMSENDRGVIHAQKIALFDNKYINHFRLNEGNFEEITFKEVFSSEGVFYVNFLEILDNYLESKAKELGLSKTDIKKILKG